MRGSHAKTAPKALTDWLALESPNWQPSYPFPNDIRQPVVTVLLTAQRGLCVYCGRRLNVENPGRFYHIEHFRPRSTYRHLAVDLHNIVLSCGPEDDERIPTETCGNAKEDWFDEGNHIEPVYPDCTNRFRFLLTGEITVALEPDEAARTMICVLNLNHRELKKDRKDILDRIDGESLDLSDFIDSDDGTVQSYAHVVCQHLGSALP